jgi:hypothetical protein
VKIKIYFTGWGCSSVEEQVEHLSSMQETEFYLQH